jgi:hypothetical protein
VANNFASKTLCYGSTTLGLMLPRLQRKPQPGNTAHQSGMQVPSKEPDSARHLYSSQQFLDVEHETCQVVSLYSTTERSGSA